MRKTSILSVVACLLFAGHAYAAKDSYTMPTPKEALRLLHEDTERRARISSGQEFFKGIAYVGAKACAGCHVQRYNEWKQTWHAKMEQWPTPATIVGDFNTTITYANTKALDLKGADVKKPDGTPVMLTYSVKTWTRTCNKPHPDITANVCRDGCDAPASPVKTAPGKSSTYYCFTNLGQKEEDNQTYTIAKALGGKWDQHYEVWVGSRLAIAQIRWAVGTKEWINNAYRPYDWIVWENGTWRPRKPHELLKERFAEAKCTGCHTTGYTFSKDSAGYWNAHGDFFESGKGEGELGIACEHCHGPGGKHVAEANDALHKGTKLGSGTSTIIHPLKDLDFQQQNQLCGKCHGRQSSRVHTDQNFQQNKDFLVGDRDLHQKARFWSFWSTSPSDQAYFWPNDWAKRNRQQYQDFQKSTHYTKAGLTCLTCHVFHGTKKDAGGIAVAAWEDGHLRQKSDRMCASCHGSGGTSVRGNVEFYQGSKMQKAGVECADCHMPKSAFRTNATSTFPRQWHGTLHTFQVATPAMEKQHGIRSSCTACHIDPPNVPGGEKRAHVASKAPQMDLAELDRILTHRQRKIRARMDRIQLMLKNARSRNNASAVRAKLDIVALDGSFGFHNFERADRLLRQAYLLARRSKKGGSVRLSFSEKPAHVPATTSPAASTGALPERRPEPDRTKTARHTPCPIADPDWPHCALY